MDCNNCEDKFKCEYYMSDYPGSSDLWKANRLCDNAEEKQKFSWIPCSKKLPTKRGDYLVTCDDGTVCIWWFVVEGDLKVWQIRLCDCKPIAWMSLPEPYND